MWKRSLIPLRWKSFTAETELVLFGWTDSQTDKYRRGLFKAHILMLELLLPWQPFCLRGCVCARVCVFARAGKKCPPHDQRGTYTPQIHLLLFFLPFWVKIVACFSTITLFSFFFLFGRLVLIPTLIKCFVMELTEQVIHKDV